MKKKVRKNTTSQKIQGWGRVPHCQNSGHLSSCSYSARRSRVSYGILFGFVLSDPTKVFPSRSSGFDGAIVQFLFSLELGARWTGVCVEVVGVNVLWDPTAIFSLVRAEHMNSFCSSSQHLHNFTCCSWFTLAVHYSVLFCCFQPSIELRVGECRSRFLWEFFSIFLLAKAVFGITEQIVFSLRPVVNRFLRKLFCSSFAMQKRTKSQFESCSQPEIFGWGKCIPKTKQSPAKWRLHH